MRNNDRSGLFGLIALKVVCCGGLLLALSGVSLGSAISALAGNGWVRAGGVALVAAGVGWWLARRRRARACGYLRDTTAEVRGKMPARERSGVPAE